MNAAGNSRGRPEGPRMFQRLLTLFFCIFIIGCKTAIPTRPVQDTPSPSNPSIRTLVAFGDSLTEGLGVESEATYPTQLERKLRVENLDWKVVNAGLSGETSSGALSRLDWVLKLKPDAIILETGANDGLRGIDPEITKRNLTALVQELQKRGIPVMLAGMKTLSNLGPDYTQEFEAVYPSVAKDMKIPLIPFFLDGVAGVPELNQEDRIHPTEEGYTLIVEKIAPAVTAWLSEIASPSPASTPNLP